MSTPRTVPPNFITEIIDDDLRRGKISRVVTRFPPEPNGYLHIGHAKAICIDFGIAHDYQGCCHLRFDDTNPVKEETEYVESIMADIRWLGFDWGEHLYYASDYFEQLYQYAVGLIKAAKAYVCDLSPDELREYRGTLTEPGRDSPYRNRSVAENLELFARMRAGELAAGSSTLRAKIDMASPNIVMRDPVLYRILHAEHHRTGNAWHIYPMYDFAHPLSDAIEGITHSLCSLEYEIHRPLYDWLVENVPLPSRPYQYEFARLNLDYTVLSKRKLIQLVKEGHVAGWDDPRLPTLAGLRRRGVRPEAIREFCARIGVAKTNSRVDHALFEHVVRDDLNWEAPRVMAVLDPLKVVLTNYPEGQLLRLDAPYWPHDVPKQGGRPVPFTRELYIERDDFMEHPPQGYKRLAPGREVRLRHAYVIRCDEVIKDPAGRVIELRCTADLDTLGQNPERKIGGAIHWVSARYAIHAEFRLYDRLFTVPDPDAGEEHFLNYLNPNSLVVKHGYVEPSVRDDPPGSSYQFERQGYFCRDPQVGVPVFNRIVALRDSWTKLMEGEREVPRRPASAVAASAERKDKLGSLDPEQRGRAARLITAYRLSADDAATLATDPALAAFFAEAVAHHANAQGIANWLLNELRREHKERPLTGLALTPAGLAELVQLIDEGVISSHSAKEVFAELVTGGGSPRAVVEARGLAQVADREALEPLVARLLAAHPDKVAGYRAGKTGLMGFFVGQVMRETQGRANPQLVQALLSQQLN